MIRYKDGNPARDRGRYLCSYRTLCNGVVIHLFQLDKPMRDPRDDNRQITHTALVVHVNRKLDASTIAAEVLSLQLGTWSVKYE